MGRGGVASASCGSAGVNVKPSTRNLIQNNQSDVYSYQTVTPRAKLLSKFRAVEEVNKFVPTYKFVGSPSSPALNLDTTHSE